MLKFFFCFVLSFICLLQQVPVLKFTDSSFTVGAIAIRRTIKFTDDCQLSLNKKSLATLDSVFKMLNKYPQLKMEISAHDGKPCKTCTTCVPSQNAANSLVAYLIKKGIDKKRITAKGMGLTQPLVDNPSFEKKKSDINKRIEFKIVYNKV